MTRGQSNGEYERARQFAVGGVFWRKSLDWAVVNVPFYFQPLMILFWSFFFFLLCRPARKTVARNLAFVRPNGCRLANYFRAFRIFHNFGWTMTETALHRILKLSFSFELVDEELVNELGRASCAIILTAHMGSYDLGAAAFAGRFRRAIRIVRAPERDQRSAQHVTLSLQAEAVKVDYSGGALVSLDLLNALRNGEIVSIQGDRVMQNVASASANLFGAEVLLPSGAFTLSLIAGAPIYPVFILRAGFRSYKVIVLPPILCANGINSRKEALAIGMQSWSEVLERSIEKYWPQWYAFGPIF